ncbi:MAG: hypothetical protein ABEK10_02630 [Candidatus Nanosalina sp.]
MLEDFNDEPFNRIYRMLESIEESEPLKTDTGIERIDDKERRMETIHNAMNYVEQAKRFLKGAKLHGSGEAYRMADDSIDDLQQNLQILSFAYPEPVEEVKPMIPEIWNEKRKVYDSLSIDPEKIVDREYNQVLINIRHQGILESSKEDTSVVVDDPHYRDEYWVDTQE